jgi:hypothetical protein
MNSVATPFLLRGTCIAARCSHHSGRFLLRRRCKNILPRIEHANKPPWQPDKQPEDGHARLAHATGDDRQFRSCAARLTTGKAWLEAAPMISLWGLRRGMDNDGDAIIDTPNACYSGRPAPVHNVGLFAAATESPPSDPKGVDTRQWRVHTSFLYSKFPQLMMHLLIHGVGK